MVDFISNLHFLNMVLVLATGSITGIWGFILFFTSKPKPISSASASPATPAANPVTPRVVSDAEVAEDEPAEAPVSTPPEVLPALMPTQQMNRPWRIALIITGIVALVQGLLGVSLVLLGRIPGTGTGVYWLHYVYGGIVALAIPIAVTYATSGKNVRRDVLIFSLAALILVAAAVRALMTGPQ